MTAPNLVEQNLEEFNVYKVEEVEKDGKPWYSLRLYGNPCAVEGIPEFEHIFGMPKGERGFAFLKYWEMRLNRAFVNGAFMSKGLSSYPLKDYYSQLNEYYKIAFEKE